MSTSLSRSSTAYLAIGSNLGDRKQHIDDAVSLLDADSRVQSVEASPIYETEAHVLSDDAKGLPFLNLVIRLETSLLVGDLMKLCQFVEHSAGRERTKSRWQPRTIDVDILLFGATTVKTERLEIPHPRMTERLFVLLPLFDLAPDLFLPMPVNRSLKDVVDACKDVHEIVPWKVSADQPSH